MKKLLTLLTAIAITCTCCVQTVKAEETNITSYSELVSFISGVGSGESKEATITESFEMTNRIFITNVSTITLNIADGVVISSPSNGENIFEVQTSGCVLTIQGTGNQTQGIFQGAIDSTSEVDHGSFINIHSGATLNISGVTIKGFNGNTNIITSGVIYSMFGTVNVNDVDFIDNKLTHEGAAIAVSGAKLTVTNSTFKNNSIVHGVQGLQLPLGGGAIYAENESDDKITIDNCKFIENSTTSAEGAGAVYLKNIKLADITNCEFKDNSTKGYGGSVNINYNNFKDDAEIKITGCEFKNNKIEQSRSNGGALYVYNIGSLEVDDCKFENNSSSNNGGAIGLNHSGVDIKKTTIENNNASGMGGAIHISESRVDIFNTTIKNNSSQDTSGAIYFINEGGDANNVLTIKSNVTIKDNTSGKDSAVCLYDAKMVLDGTNINFDNKNNNNEKEDVCFRDSEKPIEVTNDSTFTNKIALMVDETDYENGLIVKQGTYTGDLKDIFTVSRGNHNLEKTTNGLIMKIYKPIEEPSYVNEFKFSVGDLSSTDITNTYQWYSRKIKKIEKVEGTEKTYELFDSLLLEDGVTYSDGVYSYNGEEEDPKILLKGIKKGQRISFKAEAKGKCDYSIVAIVNQDNEEIMYGFKLGEDTSLNVSEIIDEAGDYLIYAGFGPSTEVSNLAVTEYENDNKLPSTSEYMTQALGGAENFCEVTYKNDNHVTKIKSRAIVFEEPKTGNNQKFTKGSEKNLEFKLEADDAQYIDFVNSGKVFLDGFTSEKELDVNDDYTFSKGSIDISINKDVIKNLTEGLHTIYVVEEITATSTEKITAVNFTINKKADDKGTQTYQVVKTSTK